MRNLMLLGLTFAFAIAVVGCGGGMTEEKYQKVLTKYYDLNLEAVKGGKEFNSDKAWDDAAKSEGFADKKAFDAAVAKSANPKLADGAKKAAEDYQKKVQAWTEEQAKKAAGGGDEKPADEGEKAPEGE